MWKKLSQKVILNHPRLTVLEDQIELPNGHQTDYVYLRHTANAATIICENDKGEILVQEEFNYPSGKVLIEFPGGTVPLVEDIQAGAQRELMEEAGIKALDLKQLGEYYPMNRKYAAKMHVFYTTNFVEEKIPHDIEEDIKSYWLTKQSLEEKIKSGEIQNINLLASWTLYKLKLKSYT